MVEEYIAPWNKADEAEVSSSGNPHPAGNPPPAGNPLPAGHPLGGVNLSTQGADVTVSIYDVINRWTNMNKTLKKAMNTRGGLYHKLVCEHRKVTDQLSAVQEQLHQAQAAVKDQAAIDALTSQIAEIHAEKDTMSGMIDQFKKEEAAHKDDLQKEKNKVARLKTEITTLKAEHKTQIQAVTDSSITTIAEAKKEFEEEAKKAATAVEENLNAEIAKLKDENRLQKQDADATATKMLEWTKLADELNH